MSTNETQFVEGLIAKAPNDRAPDYIKAKLSIKREELIAWLEQQDGDWINAEVKEGRSGKWYVAVDNWQPEQRGERQSPQRSAPKQQRQASGGGSADDFDSDIPFRQHMHRMY